MAEQPDVASLGALITGGDEDSVYCRVCDTRIDPVTGAPLEPVGPETVEAVQSYLTAAGQAEEGGVQLDLEAGPPLPGL